MVEQLFTWLEESSLAQHIGESFWFPLLESIHVIAVTFVVGAVLMVDLRLLGAAAKRYPVTGMTRELTMWSWLAFLLSVITGIGLFITRANHYAENPAFQIKFLLLACAGINMAAFHFGIWRRVASWDNGKTPRAAKVAGFLSLTVWCGVLLAGRWVGHLS